MEQSKAEISRSYRGAKNKKEQIKILSELNLCKKEDIIAILEEAGELQSKNKKEELPEQIAESLKKRYQDVQVRRTEYEIEQEYIKAFLYVNGIEV